MRPFVSVLTPTRDRRVSPSTHPLLSGSDLPCRPHGADHRRRWRRPYRRPHPDDPRIQYEALDIRVPLGTKRNRLAELAKGEILVHMDDDDYYPPDRVERAVKVLEETDAEVVGKSELAFWDLDTRSIHQYPRIGPKHACAGTLAYRKSYWDKRKFAPDPHTEERQFLANFDAKLVQFDCEPWRCSSASATAATSCPRTRGPSSRSPSPTSSPTPRPAPSTRRSTSTTGRSTVPQPQARPHHVRLMSPNDPSRPRPWSDVEREIRVSRHGIEYVLIGGAEPTQSRELLRAIRTTRQVGVKPVLVTDARALASPERLEKLVQLGLEELSVRLVGPDRRTLDPATSKGASRAALRALRHAGDIPHLRQSLICVLDEHHLTDADAWIALARKVNASLRLVHSFSPDAPPARAPTAEEAAWADALWCASDEAGIRIRATGVLPTPHPTLPDAPPTASALLTEAVSWGWMPDAARRGVLIGDAPGHTPHTPDTIGHLLAAASPVLDAPVCVGGAGDVGGGHHRSVHTVSAVTVARAPSPTIRTRWHPRPPGQVWRQVRASWCSSLCRPIAFRSCRPSARSRSRCAVAT